MNKPKKNARRKMVCLTGEAVRILEKFANEDRRTPGIAAAILIEKGYEAITGKQSSTNAA